MTVAIFLELVHIILEYPDNSCESNLAFKIMMRPSKCTLNNSGIYSNATCPNVEPTNEENDHPLLSQDRVV